MHNVAAPTPSLPQPRWRELVWPKEHGSWSLALEPVAFALLAAPSPGGMALGVGALAGFFARRPLRIAVMDAKPLRRAAARRAVIGCLAVAAVAVIATLALGGIGWLGWLLPTAVGGAVFLAFDLQQSGRDQLAEVAGSFAFASLPAAFAALAGWSAAGAAALGAAMIARAVPTVLTVRATVRARKTGERRAALPIIASLLAAGVVVELTRAGLAPVSAAVLAVVLALRSIVLLAYPRPALRASAIGIAEAVLGGVYVVLVALTWPR